MPRASDDVADTAAQTINPAAIGSASACDTGTIRSASVRKSACPWSETPGITAESRFTKPTVRTTIPLSAGSESKRRIVRSAPTRRCNPTCHAARSRSVGNRSCQSFTTNQQPASATTASGSSHNPRAQASSGTARSAAPRCHSCTRRPKTNTCGPSRWRSRRITEANPQYSQPKTSAPSKGVSRVGWRGSRGFDITTAGFFSSRVYPARESA